MKVWETREFGSPVLKQDIEELWFVDDAEEAVPSEESWAKRIIDEAWPDMSMTWSRRICRSSALCASPEAEEWQCGSFGPKQRFCHRAEGHRGKCSDLFLPADRKSLTERLKKLEKEEMDAMFGKVSSTAFSRVFDRRKLKEILKREGR